jgi:putative transposase
MASALKGLLGPDATGFSAKTVARLKQEWAQQYADWRKHDLGRDEWVVRLFSRTDGVHRLT